MSGHRNSEGRHPPGGGLRLERVQQARSARLLPLLAAGSIVVFVGLAVTKPWGSPPGDVGPLGAPRSSVGPSGSADVVLAPVAAGDGSPPGARSAVPWVTVPFIAGPNPMVSATAVWASARRHDAWGIRAIVEPGGLGSMPAGAADAPIERWAGAPPSGWASPDVSGGSVLALGVTVPEGTLVIDVRVLQQVDGRERWLDVVPVAGGSPGSPPLLWPPRMASGWGATWTPGTYRILVLTAEGVTGVGAYLPGAGSTSLQPQGADRLWVGSDPGSGLRLDPALGTGLFAGVVPTSSGSPADRPAVVTPVVLPLGGRNTTALGIASAWLDTLAGQPTSIGAHAVAGWFAGAVALGVAAPANLVIHAGRLVRLLPGAAGGRSDAADRARPSIGVLAGSPYRAAIWFEEPDGRAWEPGVYAVVVEGTGAGGYDVFGYVATLLPGTAREIAAPLAATRAWARFAGRWGVAAGLSEPLDSTGRLAVRYKAQEPEAATGGGADFSLRCLSLNLVDGDLPIVGISHPYDEQPAAIGLERVFRDAAVVEPTPRVARGVVPGLSLVAPGSGNSWAPGWYRLLVTIGEAVGALPVCVGEVLGGQLVVPSDGGTRPAGAG